MTRRVLPVTMGIVVAVFIAATAYTQLLLNNDVDAIDIASNSAPSIAYLADARAGLRLVARDAIQAAAAEPVIAATAARLAFIEHRGAIDAALAQYAKTPDYPGERERYRAVVADLARVDERMAAGQAAADANDEADAAMRALSQLNHAYLVSAAHTMVERARRRNLYAFLLDGVGVLVAFFATMLAMRTVERYLRTLARRARELEHLAIQVGHEIANPMAPLQVALHAADESLDPARIKAIERARRSVARIRETIERLSQFARAGALPATAACDTPLAPVLVAAAQAVGVEATVDGAWRVRCPESVLRTVLDDLLAASAPPPGGIDVDASASRVRVSVVRTSDGDIEGDPFDPQLHTPGADHPGIDLRLATVRRYVEACGGTVGARRRRGERGRLWIELPRA
jgi:signal transduction histidine kinase